jgi:FkbM family methyltransferase
LKHSTIHRKTLFSLLSLIGKIPLMYLILVEPIIIKFFLNKVILKKFLEYEINFDLSDPTMRKVAFGTYENIEHRIMKQLIKENDTVLDIGANYGLIALRISHLMNFKGKLEAYEPIKENLKLLKNHMNLLPKKDFLTIHNLAVGPTSGTLSLGKPDEHLGSISPAFSGFYSSDTPNNAVNVEMKGINEIIVDHKKIKLIKIDTEGMDEDIILSINKENLSKIEYLMFELTVHSNGYTKKQQELFDYLILHRFRVKRRLLAIRKFSDSKGLTPNQLLLILKYPLIIYGYLFKKISATPINFLAIQLKDKI